MPTQCLQNGKMGLVRTTGNLSQLPTLPAFMCRAQSGGRSPVGAADRQGGRDPGPRGSRDTAAPNAPPRPCPATARSSGPAGARGGSRGPRACCSPRRAEGGRGADGARTGREAAALRPRALENLTSPWATQLGETRRNPLRAGLPAPAGTVKLGRPEVPPLQTSQSEARPQAPPGNLGGGTRAEG